MPLSSKLGLFRGRRRQGPANRSAAHTARRRALDFRRTGLEQLEQRTLLSAGLQYDHVIATSDAGNNVVMVAPATGSSTPPPTAFNPAQIKQAYGIDQVKDSGVLQDGTGETIAIIDAYDDPKFVSRNSNPDVNQDPNFLASDLHQFDVEYGLPEPAGFFTKVDQTGGTNYPAGNTGWGTEIALDVEWVHALAPGAKIILVEANSNSDTDLLNGAAVWARDHSGAQVVTMSFGGSETDGDADYDSVFQSPADHGITWLASTGDGGAPGGYPAFSPNVVAVGGTTLTAPEGVYSSETGWGDSGGGISTNESQPSYQQGLVIHSGSSVINQNGERATPDVAFDADPNSGVAVCDSYSQGSAYPWLQVGGTSLSSPAWAAMIGITDEIRANHGLPSLDGASETLPTLYQIYNDPGRYASDFHDVTTGSNGYSAATGYDLVTGIGSPRANALLPDLAGIDIPPTVTGTTPSLTGGTLATGTTTLSISFSRAVVGADVAANYALQSVGPDGLLGTADDQFVPLSVSYSADVVTLTFPALAENVYRLTVRDTITDLAGNQLDGNGDGVPGSDWTTDFVVIAPNTTSFAPVSTFGSGVTAPNSVAMGDFNGDGKLDLAVANYASTASVGILLGNGNGTFAAASTVSPGSYGYSGDILADDFNGDGKLDLAVADGGEVEIVLGNGAGGFSPVTTFNSHGENSLVAADFNGDGNLDLACASDMSNTQINVLLGNGNGGFGAPTAFNSGGIQPKSLAVGDFNGDGNPDLAVVNYQSNTIGVLLGDGHGGFSAPTTFGCGGHSPLDVAVGDFNGDGKADIVVTNSWSGTVGVLLGNGSGSFGAATAFSFGVGSPEGIAVGDLNGDGKVDVAIPDFYHGAVGVLFGNGHGGFAAPVTFGSGGTSCTSAVFGDFNGDGRPDIAVANYGGNTIGVLTNTSDVFSVTDTSPHGLPFDIALGSFGTGELIQGYNNAFDGDGRLMVGGTSYQASSYTTANNGQTVITAADTLAGLTVSRQIAVPGTGDQDFARTVDVFTNPTGAPIATTVTIVGNLGSDAATNVFATSDGTGIVSPNDQWIGTDDASDGSGTPAVIHYIHGPLGLRPISVIVTGDNITWTYNLTVAAGQIVRLESLTIVATTRAAAIASARALVTGTAFGGQAAASLSSDELNSLANFAFATAPQVVGVAVAGSTWTSGSLAGGYPIPIGSGAQLVPVPEGNINQIKVTFSENVIVDQTDLLITGVNVPSYDVTDGTFSYDPSTFTATWTLPQPIGPDKLMPALNADGSDPIRDSAGNRLDGDWTNPASTTDTGTSAYPSGNGVAGGDFHFRLNVLPSDADRDGTVSNNDLGQLLKYFNKSGGWAQGDFDNNGTVDNNDLGALLANFNKTLPSGEPAAGSFPAVAFFTAATTPTISVGTGALDGSTDAATPAIVLLDTACTRPLAVTVKTVASDPTRGFPAASLLLRSSLVPGSFPTGQVSATVKPALRFLSPAVLDNAAGAMAAVPSNATDGRIQNEGQGETLPAATWSDSFLEGQYVTIAGQRSRANLASALAQQTRVHDAVLEEGLSVLSPCELSWISDVANTQARRAGDPDRLTNALYGVLAVYGDA